MRRHRERFGDERLRVLAAEAFFDARSIGRDHRYGEYERPGYAKSALVRIAGTCMLVLPPEDLHLRMEDHLRSGFAEGIERKSLAMCNTLLREPSRV